MNYFETWKKSWLDLFNNLKLLVPDIVFLILSALIGFVILYVGGLFPVVKTIYFDKDFSSITNVLARVVIAGAVFFITTFILGSSIRAVKYNYICDVLKKKKVDLSKFFDYGSRDVWNVIVLKILLFLIGLIATSAVALLTFVSGTFLFLFPIIGLLYMFAFLFVYPIMFLNRKNPLDSIKLSFKFFKSHAFHVIITGILIVLTSVGVSILSTLWKISYFTPILNSILSIFVGVWSFIYLFRSL